jgi:hypothetical protein
MGYYVGKNENPRFIKDLDGLDKVAYAKGKEEDKGEKDVLKTVWSPKPKTGLKDLSLSREAYKREVNYLGVPGNSKFTKDLRDIDRIFSKKGKKAAEDESRRRKLVWNPRDRESPADSDWNKESKMPLLATPAKRIVKEHILGVSLKEEFADLESIFHSASKGMVSVSSAPNGQDPNSHIVTLSGPAATASAVLSPNGISHKEFVDDLRNMLHANHYKLVTSQYREDVVAGTIIVKFIVKIPMNL